MKIKFTWHPIGTIFLMILTLAILITSIMFLFGYAPKIFQNEPSKLILLIVFMASGISLKFIMPRLFGKDEPDNSSLQNPNGQKGNVKTKRKVFTFIKLILVMLVIVITTTVILNENSKAIDKQFEEIRTNHLDNPKLERIQYNQIGKTRELVLSFKKEPGQPTNIIIDLRPSNFPTIKYYLIAKGWTFKETVNEATGEKTWVGTKPTAEPAPEYKKAELPGRHTKTGYLFIAKLGACDFTSKGYTVYMTIEPWIMRAGEPPLIFAYDKTGDGIIDETRFMRAPPGCPLRENMVPELQNIFRILLKSAANKEFLKMYEYEDPNILMDEPAAEVTLPDFPWGQTKY